MGIYFDNALNKMSCFVPSSWSVLQSLVLDSAHMENDKGILQQIKRENSSICENFVLFAIGRKRK